MKNLLLFNRFAPAQDGWFLLVPKGEHPWQSEDGKERLIQVVDDAAVESMVNRFKAAGEDLLIDADHLSNDLKNKTEAYGWGKELRVTAAGVECRPEWTDLGTPAVANKRYRFISPVFPRRSVESLGNGRVRVLELAEAGLTNKPNMDMPPLTNRQQQDEWLKNYGTSEGARKGWETRKGGSGASEKPKRAATKVKLAATKEKIAAKAKAPVEKPKRAATKEKLTETKKKMAAKAEGKPSKATSRAATKAALARVTAPQPSHEDFYASGAYGHRRGAKTQTPTA